MMNRRVMIRSLARALGLGTGLVALSLAGCENREVGSMPKMRKRKNEILEELDGPTKTKRRRGKGG